MNKLEEGDMNVGVLIAEARDWLREGNVDKVSAEFILGLVVTLEAVTKPRGVTTVEELDALPFWSIVKGLNGVARKNHDGWTLDGYLYLRQSDDLEEFLIGPFTVIFTPGADETP